MLKSLLLGNHSSPTEDEEANGNTEISTNPSSIVKC